MRCAFAIAVRFLIQGQGAGWAVSAAGLRAVAAKAVLVPSQVAREQAEPAAAQEMAQQEAQGLRRRLRPRERPGRHRCCGRAAERCAPGAA